MRLALLAITLLLAGCQNTSGGNPTQPQPPAPTATPAPGTERHDFDGDGMPDRLEYSVFRQRVLAGDVVLADLSATDRNGLRLLFKDFAVVYLDGRRPSVVYAAHWVPADAVFPRYPALPVLLLNGEGLQMTRLEGYPAAAYAVACAYPQQTASPLTLGAFCLFGAYGSDAKARTALVYIGADGQMQDVTAAAGLPWVGGIAGTDLAYLPPPNPNACGNPQSREKWHVMGVGWLDFDGDGLMDLIVSGQHMRTFAYRQYATRSALGFAFAEMAVENTPRENLVLGADDLNAPTGTHCAYIAAEAQCGDWDHLACYEAGAWVRRELPERIRQDVGRVEVGRDGDHITFRTASPPRVFRYPARGSSEPKAVTCEGCPP